MLQACTRFAKIPIGGSVCDFTLWRLKLFVCVWIMCVCIVLVLCEGFGFVFFTACSALFRGGVKGGYYFWRKVLVCVIRFNGWRLSNRQISDVFSSAATTSSSPQVTFYPFYFLTDWH